MDDFPEPEGSQSDERIGIFRSWNWLYAAVVVYTLAATILLYYFTRVLDFSLQ